MADINKKNVKVQVVIDEETKYGTFRDALYFSHSDYAKLTDEEVEAQKNARREKWLLSMDAWFSTPTPKATEGDLLKEKETLASRINEIDVLLEEQQ